MAAPFLKLKTPGLLYLLEKFSNIKSTLDNSGNSGIQPATGNYLSGRTGWINDFTISKENSFLPALEIILASIWLSGILVMAWFFIKGAIKLYHLKQSALPLQNQQFLKYLYCLVL